MLKKFRVERAIRNIVKRISNRTIRRIVEKYGTLNGYEENITSKLEDNLSIELIDSIEQELSGKIIKGLSFDVFTYKKKQENNTGADILGVVDLQINSQRVIKTYLAQCKVGIIIRKDDFGHHTFRCRSSNDILAQAEKMLSISSDSFFFIYTEEGIFVLPAFDIRLCNKKHTIDSDEIYFHGLGVFYAEFFKCFIGDEKVIQGHGIMKDIKRFSEQDVLFPKLEFNNMSYVTIKDNLESTTSKS